MPIIETKAAAAATELSAVSGAVIPPGLLAALMQFLMSLLGGCVPPAMAHKRIAKGGRLLTRTVERQAAAMVPDCDPQLVAAAVLDQADTLTPADWAEGYKEAAAAKAAMPPA